MRASTKHLTVGTGRPLLSLVGFARTAALASFGAALTMFLFAAAVGNPRVWEFIAILCVSTVAAISVLTLAIGCLVTAPMAAVRLWERLNARRRAQMVNASQLWDDGIDGPER
jgi:hypothetical protein